MQKLLSAPLDFQSKAGSQTVHVKKSAMPCLSDFIYPVLLDIDPTQGIEDEYKHKHDTIFSWRMLKQIAFIEIKNFSWSKQFVPFEGNIEEQALSMHEKFPLRDIPDKVELSDEDDDDDMFASDKEDKGKPKEEDAADKKEKTTKEQKGKENGTLVNGAKIEVDDGPDDEMHPME